MSKVLFVLISPRENDSYTSVVCVVVCAKGVICAYVCIVLFSEKNNSEVLDRFQQMSLKVQMMKTKSIQCLEEMRVIDGYSMRLEKMATDHIK